MTKTSKCKTCNGRGEIPVPLGKEKSTDTLDIETGLSFRRCPKCKGSGKNNN